MTTGIYGNGYGYNDYFYNQSPYGNYNYQNSGIYGNNAINFTSTDNTKIVKKKKVEKDDGNIGFWKATKNFVKGVGKFFTGMFTDNNGKFSLGKTLKTVAVAVGVGAVCVLTAGTAVPAMLAAAGVGISALGMGKAAINIATAQTDAEAEAAWQSLGSNTTAAALAVTGAKAVAKANGVNTQGLKGTVDSVKYVFSESGSAIKSSATGVMNAAKSASGTGISGKFNAVKNEVSAQAGKFKATVKDNYNNTVYGTKGKIDDDAASLNKKSNELQQKIDKAKDGSPEKAKLQKQQSQLNAKRDGIQEINNKNTWESANKTIEANKTQLNAKQNELARAPQADKARIQGEIDALTTKIKAQEGVLARRTGEAQHIRSQIDAKQAKVDQLKQQTNYDPAKVAQLESEISALKARQEFTIPNKNDAGALTAENIKASNEMVAQNRADVIKAQNAEAAANAKLQATNPSDAAAVAQAQQELHVAQQALNTAKTELNTSLTEYQSLMNKFNAQQGQGYTHVPSEIARAGYNDPATRWLTLGVSGKSNVTTTEAMFYSMLSPQEKAWFNALPDDQKAALLEQFSAAVA